MIYFKQSKQNWAQNMLCLFVWQIRLINEEVCNFVCLIGLNGRKLIIVSHILMRSYIHLIQGIFMASLVNGKIILSRISWGEYKLVHILSNTEGTTHDLHLILCLYPITQTDGPITARVSAVGWFNLQGFDSWD